MGDEHLAVAETLIELGWLLLIKDSFSWKRRLSFLFGLPFHSKAESLLEALENQRHLLNDDHKIMLSFLNFLGTLYFYKRRYREAKSLFVQSLEMGKRLLGDAHPLTTNILNNLALVYFEQRCYRKAESLYMQALEIQQNSQANDHPKIAVYLNNLGLFYKKRGHYRKAESFYVRAKEHAERTLGANHPKTISYRKTSNSFISNAIINVIISIPLIISSVTITLEIIRGKDLFLNILFLFLFLIILIVQADIGYALLGITYALLGISVFNLPSFFYLFISLFFLLLALQIRRSGMRGGILYGMGFLLTKTWLWLAKLI